MLNYVRNDLILFIFFCLWFLISVIAQFPVPLSKMIRSLDGIRIIPRWNFFAPTPGTFDVNLLFRDCLPDGNFTKWQEVPPAISPRFLNPIWNPGRRYNKALLDLTTHLVRTASLHKDAPSMIKLSLPYLSILNFVSYIPRQYEAIQTQFLLMRTNRRAINEQPAVIFTSSLHFI